jgi:ATP-dependent helicase IRC3
MDRLLRTAKWRTGPATDPQKKFIANRLLNKANKKDRKGMSEEQIQHMTKGEAANLITRLKHGAQVNLFYYSQSHGILTPDRVVRRLDTRRR